MLNGFKDFILRGNIISMAIGLAVGAAFTAVVSGFSTAFITPLIGLATGSVGDFSAATFSVEGAEFPYGKFLAAAIAFLITAAVLYFGVVVPMTKVQTRFASAKNEKVDIKAALRDCPRCYAEIPSVASRCSHCTSDVDPDLEALALAGLPAPRPGATPADRAGATTNDSSGTTTADRPDAATADRPEAAAAHRSDADQRADSAQR